ncbi:hypothetical protein [Dokdonella sp.]|uniref:hypothetical protein n=1 Tax=Dokdonella sp. TaxID=2291710 RepID=UPI0037831244
MDNEQHAATISLATIYGELRDTTRALREAQQRALDVINARFWNSGIAGCADAARRISPRMANVIREGTALADEATRLVDQMRDAVRTAPHFDARLPFATRPHEPAPAPTATTAASSAGEAQSFAQAAQAAFARAGA